MRSRQGISAVCATAAAATALALVAGCGSSESAQKVETTTITVGGRTSTVVISKSGTASKSASGLQTDTTPKYAAPPANAPVQSGTVQIEYRNIAINPDTLKVKVGSTIRWTNYDPVLHNVTSKGGPATFKSKNFGEGRTFEFKVTTPGVIHYECTNHPVTMNGTIEVVS